MSASPASLPLLPNERTATLPGLRPRWAWTTQFALATVIGTLAYLVSLLIEPQMMRVNNFGIQWWRMSEDPFAFYGQFPHRMLAPFIAHYVGMGGQHWIEFTQITAVILLTLVFYVARWRGARIVDASLVTLAVAVSGAIQYYKFEMAGYVDHLGYSLTLLTWMAAKRTFVFWPLILLNLTNHEMVGFFLPWFLFLRRQARASLLADGIGLVTVLGLYILFRQYVAAHAPAWTYDGNYFRDNCFLPITFLWIWLLAAIYQLQTFGPLLAVVIWHSLRLRPALERMHTLLIVGGFLTILFFAYDANRHTNMMCIPLIIASCRFLGDRRSRIVFGCLILGTAVLSVACKWLYGWFAGVIILDCDGHLLSVPENRFNLPMQWQVAYGMFVRTWPKLFALAWEALFLFALAEWLFRRGIGNSRVTNAGLVIPAIPEAATAAFRRVTGVLRRRPRSRDPRAGR